jgi:hypothetical protein
VEMGARNLYEYIVRRKTFASLVSSFIISVILLLIAVLEGAGENLDITGILKGILLNMVFTGVFIFTYGIMVSVLLEYVYKKMGHWGQVSIIVYIISHGIFGGVFIGFINSWQAAILGVVPAIIFGWCDVWLLKKLEQGKKPGKISIHITAIVLITFIILTIYGV